MFCLFQGEASKHFQKLLRSIFSKYFQPSLKLPILLALQTPSSSELEGTQKGLREARMGAVPTARPSHAAAAAGVSAGALGTLV